MNPRGRTRFESWQWFPSFPLSPPQLRAPPPPLPYLENIVFRQAQKGPAYDVTLPHARPAEHKPLFDQPSFIFPFFPLRMRVWSKNGE